MRKQNILKEKSFAFALRIVKLNQFIIKSHNEFVLSKQILRCGTAIGALVRESENASSKKDFIYKLSIALKETDETSYWLDLIHQSGYVETNIHHSLMNDCKELVKLLVASIKTSKTNVA